MRSLALLAIHIAFAAPAFALFAGPAFAGDMATLGESGFSADGKVFAFEEYGVQDGSGFPYANRFYIDTANDSFLTGTPIRVRIDDEAATPAEARDKARSAGEAVLPAATIAENPGFLAGFNAITELSADPGEMTVNPRPVEPAIDPALTFRIDTFDLPAPAGRCDGIEGVKGFRLSRVDAGTGAETIIHEDTTVPASRNCPLDYRIGGIRTLYPVDGGPVFAVLIAIRGFGFEGPDYRWLAVTGAI